MQTTVSVNISPISRERLRRFAAGRDETLDELVCELLNRADDGLERPGSWERGWLEQVYGDVEAPNVSDCVSVVAGERRSTESGDRSPQWIGRVLGHGGWLGDVLYDSEPYAEPQTAFKDALRWALENCPEHRLLIDQPEKTEAAP